LLDPANRIALAVEQTVDATRKRDVVRAIIAAVAGALERAQLRELGFPIAQYVLRDAELGAQFANRTEGVRRLFAVP
jgi:hypothetical protein